MGLEAAVFINQLVATNPVGATDPKSQGDDHLRLIKSTLLATFPAITGAVTATHVELNQLHGGVLTSIGNGAAATPAYSFAGDTDTGMYHISANRIGFATNGVRTVFIDSTFMQSDVVLALTDGLVGAPAYTFSQDGDTGFFRRGSGDVGYAANGVLTGVLNSQGIGFTDGLAATPSLFFAADPDTGIYRVGANAMGFAANGTLMAQISATFFDINTTIFLNDGTAANPILAFDTDPDTGIYHVAADTIAIAVGGIQTVTVSPGTLSTPNATNIGVLNSTGIAINAQSAGAATAGGATLPANPQGFIVVSINGTSRKIPYYQT